MFTLQQSVLFASYTVYSEVASEPFDQFNESSTNYFVLK